ncbi:FkbM family methyltransferase, partial [bacterium]|nr:FkbM family methyltransferase [bacterium]
RRRATQAFRFTLGQAGRVLPLSVKRRLAKRSTKLGYLLVHDGDLLVEDYLGEYRVWADARQAAERAILFGAYDQELALAASQYLKKGGTAIDVGANVGATAFVLARQVGEQGRVHCFEPGPGFAARLRRNLELNPALQRALEVHEVGLSDKPDTLLWSEDPLFPGNGFFGKRGREIPVVTLDTALPNLERLDFVKIDVEGMEHKVLAGAKALLARHRPAVFFETAMDFETYHRQPIRKYATDLLLGLGYHLLRLNSKQQWVPCSYPHLAANTLAIPT